MTKLEIRISDNLDIQVYMMIPCGDFYSYHLLNKKQLKIFLAGRLKETAGVSSPSSLFSGGVIY